jgi:hypothetical protein
MLERQLAAGLWVVAPDLGPSGGVERYDVLTRGAEEEPVADLQRRDLESRLLRIAGAAANVAGMVGPGDIELPDIGRRYLVQRRVALGMGGPSIGTPTVGKDWSSMLLMAKLMMRCKFACTLWAHHVFSPGVNAHIRPMTRSLVRVFRASLCNLARGTVLGSTRLEPRLGTALRSGTKP